MKKYAGTIIAFILVACVSLGAKVYLDGRQEDDTRQQARMETVARARSEQSDIKRLVGETRVRIRHVYPYEGPSNFEHDDSQRLIACHLIFDTLAEGLDPFKIHLMNATTHGSLHYPPAIALLEDSGRRFVQHPQWPPDRQPFQCLFIYPVRADAWEFRLTYHGNALTREPVALDTHQSLPMTPSFTDMLYTGANYH